MEIKIAVGNNARFHALFVPLFELITNTCKSSITPGARAASCDRANPVVLGQIQKVLWFFIDYLALMMYLNAKDYLGGGGGGVGDGVDRT